MLQKECCFNNSLDIALGHSPDYTKLSLNFYLQLYIYYILFSADTARTTIPFLRNKAMSQKEKII